MHRILSSALCLLYSACLPAFAQAAAPPTPGHYLFAWTGDEKRQGNDFLAVIDANPNSATYGKLITTLGTDQQTVRIHHTEYEMPASGMLFANDHDVGRTFIFDVNDPLHPKVVTSFTDMAGYMHPHSFVRLPNGNVIATFQHALGLRDTGKLGATGGLVEIDDRGNVVRSASTADPAFPDALLMPYGVAVLPGQDRIVSTNSSMHDPDLMSGVTYQVWRLSDLKLLKTAYFDPGAGHYAHIAPQEPRVAADGSVYVQSLGCGIERITGLTTEPVAKLVHTFPGNWCGVPTIVGNFLIQSVPAIHGLIALDISNPEKPREVSRLSLSDEFRAHWTGWDAKTKRLVTTGSENRIFLVKLDTKTGALAVDEQFKDDNGKPGFDMANRKWPHGWTGSGVAARRGVFALALNCHAFQFSGHCGITASGSLSCRSRGMEALTENTDPKIAFCWWTAPWVATLGLLIISPWIFSWAPPISYCIYSAVRVFGVLVILVVTAEALNCAYDVIGEQDKPWYMNGFLVAVVFFWALFPPTWFFTEYLLFEHGRIAFPEGPPCNPDSHLPSCDKQLARLETYADFASKIWAGMGAVFLTLVALSTRRSGDKTDNAGKPTAGPPP